MKTDGSYPAYSTKTSVKSGAEGSSLVLSDLQEDSLLVANTTTYAYGTVDGTKTANAVVRADSSLLIKLYYKYEKQSSSGGGGVTYYTVTFNGNGGYPEVITRSIASRFDTLTAGKTNGFTDIADTYWAKAYISSSAEKGWIKGYANGTFRPENHITRAEVVTFVYRMLERYCDRSYAQCNADGLRKYGDLSSVYWAYFDIMEASNWHKYEKASSSETWSGIVR